MVIVLRGGGRAPRTLPPGPIFSIVMEGTPESGRCHSVSTLWGTLLNAMCAKVSSDYTELTIRARSV
jgi:hypothetical protein